MDTFNHEANSINLSCFILIVLIVLTLFVNSLKYFITVIFCRKFETTQYLGLTLDNVLTDIASTHFVILIVIHCLLFFFLHF
jgi:hypothetical protein